MSTSGIQGQILEVTVVACINLKDTEWISRQDPYVRIEYDKDRFRTRTCTGGGKNPLFQEKFVYTLIQGLRELNFSVWNSNTVKYDDFIGSGKVHLQKVFSTGFDDSTWTLMSKTGRHSGELRLIMHYANANSQKPFREPHSICSTVSNIRLDIPQVPDYSPPPPAAAPYAPPASAPPYPPASAYLASPPYSSYPHNPAPYPPYPYKAASAYPQPYEASSAYPPQPYTAPSAYPPQPYPPVPQGSLAAYPPEPHIAPSAYPPQLYPPPAQGLPCYPQGSAHSDPPPPQGSPYYPAGSSHSDPYILVIFYVLLLCLFISLLK